MTTATVSLVALQIYYYMAFNILATYADPPVVIPRYQSRDFIQPRYVWYRMRLRQRLRPLRRWFLLFGGYELARAARAASSMQLRDLFEVASGQIGGEVGLHSRVPFTGRMNSTHVQLCNC
jgi:hypothetical protein